MRWFSKDQRAVNRRRQNATHRHVKTGGLYILLHRATLEKDHTPMCVYQGVITGVVWVRPAVEFDDGRFEERLQGEIPLW